MTDYLTSKNESCHGEKLVQALFRLLQVVKIHQANNRLFIESIAEFRRLLNLICEEETADSVSLRAYRGRLYLNSKYLACTPNFYKVVHLLMDYLQERELQGVSFYQKENMPDEEIIHFIQSLNLANKQKDPVSWLQVQLDVGNCAWVELLLDHDFKIQAADYDPEEGATQDHTHVMPSMARTTYAHALTSVVAMNSKLMNRKRVGIQKAKRAVQSMIDILVVNESLMLGLSTIRDYDDCTYTHSVNVSILAMCLGNRLGLDRTSVERLGLCGLFHDLGKIDVPIDIIKKPGNFTDEEYEEIKKHPLHSVRRIIQLNADHVLKSKLLLPPFEHHLGVDLNGYPQTGRRVPLSLFGRILAVTDHYDALTSNRPYRSSNINPNQALKMMLAETGTKLDYLILKVFIDLMGVYPVGTMLVLDSKEIGLAVETSENTALRRPMVQLLIQEEGGKLKKGELVDLSEQDRKSGRFKRNVVKCLHPNEYGIQPSDYLL